MVVVEPWADQKLMARVAEEAGARMVVLNAKLGAVSDPGACIACAADTSTALVEAAR